MRRIILIGYMGSGKTTIGKAFATLGVSVYNCDAEAHRLTAPSFFLGFFP